MDFFLTCSRSIHFSHRSITFKAVAEDVFNDGCEIYELLR